MCLGMLGGAVVKWVRSLCRWSRLERRKRRERERGGIPKPSLPIMDINNIHTAAMEIGVKGLTEYSRGTGQRIKCHMVQRNEREED